MDHVDGHVSWEHVLEEGLCTEEHAPEPAAGPVVSRTSALEALNSSRVDLDAAAAVR